MAAASMANQGIGGVEGQGARGVVAILVECAKPRFLRSGEHSIPAAQRSPSSLRRSETPSQCCRSHVMSPPCSARATSRPVSGVWEVTERQEKR
jgi:hypothetical protein